MGCLAGVMSADPERTRTIHPGVRSFSTSRGRLAAMVSGVRWSQVVVVGGGELLQDRSSLFYSPFNLMPLLLARLFRRRSFCWAVGIGKSHELARMTPHMARFALSACSGITSRDPSTHQTLIRWGLSSPVLKPAADSALLLGRSYHPGPVDSSVLGAAPRNVSNRKGSLLPLELRRRLPGYCPLDPSPSVRAWAALLDSHMEATGCSVVLFPFHTGTLSNDDHLFCALVRDAMKHPERVSLARFTSIGQTLALMAGCRVMVTTPLHGAILSVVAGALPVAVPYSSKCTRFMEMAGLESLSPDSPDGTPVPETAVALESAWSRCGQWWEHLARTREMMMKAAENTADHFRRRILGC